MVLHFKKVLNRKVTVLGFRPPLAVRCSPDTSVLEAVRTMQSAQIGSILVTEKEKIVGIFTERDFLLKIAGNGIALEKVPIERYMTKSPVCVAKTARILDALKLMRKGNFRHLIVTDSSHRLERIISIKDVTNYLIDVISESFELGIEGDISSEDPIAGAS